MTPNHDRLGSALRDLPAVRASEDFTDNLIARLDRDGGHKRRSAAAAWTAVVAGLALLAALYGVTALDRRAATDEADASFTAQVREIRRQHDALTMELDRLRSRTRDTAPIVYLGSDDRVDYVLDLSPFLLEEANGFTPAAIREESTTF